MRAPRDIDRRTIMVELNRMDKALKFKYIAFKDITELNDTMLACARIVTESCTWNAPRNEEIFQHQPGRSDYKR